MRTFVRNARILERLCRSRDMGLMTSRPSMLHLNRALAAIGMMSGLKAA